MNFERIIKNRTKEIKECKEQIKGLKKLPDEDAFKKEKASMIDLLNKKISLLKNIHQDNFKELPKKLDKLDDKIYKQYWLLRQIEKEKKKTKKIISIFSLFFISMQIKDMKHFFLSFFRYISKNPSLFTILASVFASLMFGIYFFNLGYAPSINKESALNYALILISSSILTMFAILIIFVIIFSIVLLASIIIILILDKLFPKIRPFTALKPLIKTIPLASVITIMPLFVLALFQPEFAMSNLKLGDYTPKSLTLDIKNKGILPDGFDCSGKITCDNNVLKIHSPYVLSNIGDDYYIELKDKQDKPYRFTIPKSLVLSQEFEPEDSEKSKKPEKNQDSKAFKEKCPDNLASSNSSK